MGALIATIFQTQDHRFRVSFIGAEARSRMPAERVFDTIRAAREWIADEASAVQLQVRCLLEEGDPP